MGKTGLQLKNGALTPSGADLEKELAMWGPSTKPGDRAIISAIVFKGNRIRFEVNGGPVRKKKWFQHIEIGGAGGTTPIAPSDANANPRGSFVDLVFDKYIPDLKPQELKDLLRPVFDFDSKSALDAYLETVPPNVKQAIKDHHVLVGMNREMVLYAKGQPPRKTREKDGDVEYEEWIYGQPPQDVDFVRFVGEEVIRLETMKVDGQKIVKTDKEVDTGVKTAEKTPQPEEHAAHAPSLRRPGEEMPNATPGSSAPPQQYPTGTTDPTMPSPGTTQPPN